MHFKKLIAILILLILTLGCTQDYCPIIELEVVPKVDAVVGYNDEVVINNKATLSFDSAFQVSANFLQSYILKGSGINLNITQDRGTIQFIKNDRISAEGYKLETFKDVIKITASTDQGAFYAVQTLRQLMPAALENGSFKGDKISVEALSIEDQPQFSYRGMHLDVSRHMYSVDFIKKYIDAMAMLKMNTFHWHLTDDQGWRIEIKTYPRLQEIAAFRDETLVGHYSNQPHQFDGKKYGGYYTQEEIKDIVAYAKKRFVTVIPEIEMPGHAKAAIAAYPELGCNREQVEVATKWGVFEEIYCPNQKTFTFLEGVLDEVLELFPSKYIHIGGDEAPKTRWKNCAHCQALIKKEGLKDEHQLQSYFMTKMERYLNSKGRQIIGWDEILEGGLAPNATVMSWRGTRGAVEAAKSGHNVIMTPTSHCYFDYYQSDNEDEPLAIGGFLPLEKVYNFNPIPEELTKVEANYVLGAQGNIWTEYMPTEDQVEYMAFPRILAISEVLWSNPEQKNYIDFAQRLENFHKRLDALDINYANHLYQIEGNQMQISGEDGWYYQLHTLTDSKTIRYTLDGSEPNINSEVYQDFEMIPITESTTIKAAVFRDEKQLGKIFTQNINYHKAFGAKIRIDKQPHKAYSGSGVEGLVNGVSGSDKRYGDKEWLGFWGDDIEISIDFDKAKVVDSIKTRFHNGNGQWIYAPKALYLKLIRDDGSIATDKITLRKSDKNMVPFNYKFNYPKGLNIKVKSIVITVPNHGTIAEGKQGSGNKAWTFIDEIIVN